MKKTIEEQILEIKKTQPISKHQLYFKGKIRTFDVYEVNPNLLRFNYLNGRIGSEVLEHEGTEGGKISNYSVDELNNLIENFIWSKTVQKNIETKKNIKNRGQLEPGVITRDGIVVDGNRRFMCVRKLNREGENIQFKTIILDETYEDGGEKEKQIKILETQIQLGTDEKVGYSPLEKYWKVIDFMDKYINITSPTMSLVQLQEIMKLKNEQEVHKLYGIGKLMQEYLNHIGAPNIYSRLKDTEDLFIKLYVNLNLYKNGKGKVGWSVGEFELDEYKTIGFNTIRWIYNADKSKLGDWDPKKVRSIYFTDSQISAVLPNKNIWEELRSFHEENIETDDNFISPDDYMYESKYNVSIAAAISDKKWADKVSDKFKHVLGRSKSKLEDKAKINQPEKLISESLQKLTILIDEDKFKSSGDVVFEQNVIESLLLHPEKNYELINNIRKISERLKREIKN